MKFKITPPLLGLFIVLKCNDIYNKEGVIMAGYKKGKRGTKPPKTK